MIGKFFVRASFSAVTYVLKEKDTEKKPEVLLYNKAYGSANDLRKQFEEVADTNSRLKKPSMHIVLSGSPEDTIDNSTFIEIAEELADEFKFKESQFIVVRHYNTNHDHIHISINRQSLENSKVVSDSMAYKRISQFCRRIENQFKLKKVKSPNKFLPPEERHLTDDKRKLRIKEIIKDSLQSSHNFKEFTNNLHKKGISSEIGRGIKLSDDKITIKGSDVGFSLQNILNHLKSNILKELTPPEQRTKQLNINL